MKNKIIVFILIFFSSKITLLSQKTSFYLTSSLSKEIDFFTPLSPFGLNLQTKLGPLMLQAEYKYAYKTLNEFQILKDVNSFGGKIGLIKGLNLDKYVSHAFTMGYYDMTNLKKVEIGNVEYPTDANGNKYEMPKALIYNQVKFISVGYNFFSISDAITQKVVRFSLREKFVEKEKVKYNQINFSFDLMFAINNTYDTSIMYSPWNYYIPKKLNLNSDLRKKNFGLKVRFDVVTYRTLGMFMEMGIMPGVKVKSEHFNDFNMTTKMGVIANIFYHNDIKKK